MFEYILLIVGVGYFTIKAYQFEEITRLSQFIVPLYAFLMGFMKFRFSAVNIGIAMVLACSGILISWFQSLGCEIRQTNQMDKHGRNVILLKRNTMRFEIL